MGKSLCWPLFVATSIDVSTNSRLMAGTFSCPQGPGARTRRSPKETGAEAATEDAQGW